MNATHDHTIVVRRADERDADFLQALGERLIGRFSPPWLSVNGLRQFHLAETAAAVEVACHPTPRQLVLVADNTSTMGPLAATHVSVERCLLDGELEALIRILIVSANAERRGLATLLLRHAECWAMREGVTRMSLEVFADNERARALYSKLGFVEETVRMTKSLRKVPAVAGQNLEANPSVAS